jgi:hypothetical protein
VIKNIKMHAEYYGTLVCIIGLALLIIGFIIIIIGKSGIEFISVSLGFLSVGLGLSAIGMSNKSDVRYTELLNKINKTVNQIPIMLKDEILTPSGKLIVKSLKDQEDKILAQKRLDEDTKKVGYVRGEIFEIEDGNWAIRWGGKYPL